MSAWGCAKRASVVASCMIACVTCASMGYARSINVHGWQCVEHDTRTIWGTHRLMSAVAKDHGKVHARVVLTLRSPVDNQLLSIQVEDIERTRLTGTYTIADKGIHMANYIEDEVSPSLDHVFAVDGRVDVSIVDATMFPPTYRYDIELYLLPYEQAMAWNEHRELYSISHPDDAIYLSGSVTLQPEFTCELGKTKWTWLINESGGAGFIPTQPSYEVEPRCLEFAGVDLK